MADDIVTRLRYAAKACNHGFPNGAGDSFPDPTYCGGCLRLNDATDEIERLRAAGDALAAAHADDLCDCDQPECVAIRAAHDAWQEVRRG